MDELTQLKQRSDSDVVFEVCCSVCEDDNMNTEAQYQCVKCEKHFCEGCVALHNKLHKNHSVLAKEESHDWTGRGTGCKFLDQTLELCEEHSAEQLTMFCKDHSKLLCQRCHLASHKHCENVALIADMSNYRHDNLEDTAAKLSTLQDTFRELATEKERTVLSLNANYEQVLQKLLDFRLQVHVLLVRLQQTTLNEIEICRENLLSSLHKDKENCKDFQTKLKGLRDDVLLNKRSGREFTFVAFRKCEEQISKSEKVLQELSRNDYVDINFYPNKNILQFLSACSTLGDVSGTSENHETTPDPNNVVRLQDRAEHNVKMDNESLPCSLSGICETTNSELMVTDFHKKCVKLLDEAYTVIDVLHVRANPYSVCSVSDLEMAVTICDRVSTNEIVFIRKDNGKLIKGSGFKVEHSCYGVAHHQGDMFVTSGTAVYIYTVKGRLVKKLYENTLGEFNVVGVAVSPDGKRIYVTDITSGKLHTLTREGSVTATLHDPMFINKFLTCNVHVADVGHVYVFGKESISQVDTDWRTLLKTHNMGVSNPASVLLSMRTSRFHVGAWNNDNIVVFKANL